MIEPQQTPPRFDVALGAALLAIATAALVVVVLVVEVAR